MNGEAQICLGLNFLGDCESYFHDEYSFYNFGAAVAVLGVLIAAKGLVDTTIKIRLAFYERASLGLTLVVISPIIILIGELLPFIPGEAIPLVGYRIFYEILGALISSIGLGITIYYATTPITKITSKNLDSFEKLLVECIGRGGLYLNSIIQELRFSFPSYYGLLSEKKSQQCNTLSLLSDKDLLYELTNNLPSLKAIIDVLNKSNIDKKLENGFIEKLYGVLLANPRSIFTRELKGLSFGDFRDGAYIKNFLSLKLLLDYQGMSPSKEWFTEGEKTIFEENFIVFSGKILEETLNDKDIILHSEYPRLLFELFKTIAGIIQSSPTPEKLDLWFSWNHYLGQFYYNDIIDDYLSKKVGLFEEVTLGYADEYNDIYSNKTIFDAITFGLFEISVSYLFYNKNTKEDSWGNRDIIMRVFDLKEYKTAKFLYKETEKRINIYLKQEIKKNLEGWYPMIINIFFHLYGYQIAQSIKENEEIKDPFIMDILLLLKEKLPLISKGFIRGYDSVEKIDDFAIHKSKEILRDIFTDNVEYIADRNTIRFFYREREAFIDVDLNKVN